jgi:PPK2 family polyphosphate:nucleotide phosphotransferase
MPSLKITAPCTVRLADVPTGAPDGLEKEEAERETRELGDRLDQLEELLYAAGTHSLLLVLQGMDTSGKDGTIRRLFQYCNAQGARVAPFKVPTAHELARDFLWRVHREVPGKGEMVVFNRSHYEDVLVVRVHSLVPQEVWSRRYERINEFEALLAENGTVVLKVFLHISREEQEKRLFERELDPEKAWKLSVGDWKERERWDDYQAAYEDALGKCASAHAPWVVVPADRKWYRDLLVLREVVAALEPLVPAWRGRLEAVGAKAKAELEAFRAG